MSENKKSIIRIKFKGPRFDGDAMPLGSVAELTRLQRILFEIARTQYLLEAPGKVRVPNNFYEKLSLGVTKFKNGSKSPVLELENIDPQASFAGFTQEDLITLTYNKFISKLNDLSTKSPSEITSTFSPQELSLFRTFGSTLHDDDEVLLGRRKRGHQRIKLNRDAISRVHLAADSLFDTNVKLIGRIEAVSLSGKASVKTVDNGTLNLNLTESNIDIDLSNALGKTIEATAIASRDLSGTIKSLKDIIKYSIPENVDKSNQLLFAEKLIRLLDLESGWYEGEGIKPRGPAISTAYKIAGWMNIDYSKIPVSPLIDGGANLTPRFNDWLLSIQCYNNSRIEVSGYNKSSKSGFDEFFPNEKDRFQNLLTSKIGDFL
jgi:hypothetical protein